MNISNEVATQLAELLQEKFGFATVTALDKAVADVIKKTHERTSKGNQFSLSKLIRGMVITNGRAAINEQTKDADLAYTKALSTGSTPGLTIA